MRIYRVIIRADKYPTEYSVNASNWSAAVSRGVREWRKHFARKETGDELNIRVIRSSELLTAGKED